MWIQASHGFAGLEKFMVPVLQGLGRLDCDLISEDDRFAHLSELERGAIQENIELTSRFTLSYLWVLVRCFVRTIAQRCNADANIFGEILTNRIRALKIRSGACDATGQNGARRKESATDYPIAYPAINRRYGIAWHRC